jgi:hypothetical protein
MSQDEIKQEIASLVGKVQSIHRQRKALDDTIANIYRAARHRNVNVPRSKA